MPNYMLGKEMTIQYNGFTVAVGTSYGLNINKSLVEVTSLASAGWKEQFPDLKDWSVDFDGLVAKSGTDASSGFDYIIQTIKADASVSIALKPSTTANKYETGIGYITKLSLKGGKDGVVTFSGSVNGTGPLSTMTTP